jgi:hypothetical protein
MGTLQGTDPWLQSKRRLHPLLPIAGDKSHPMHTLPASWGPRKNDIRRTLKQICYGREPKQWAESEIKR